MMGPTERAQALLRRFARKCLANWDSLGAVAGERDCRYDYGNGHFCAIGVGLSKRVRAKCQGQVDSDGALGGCSLSFLVGAGIMPDDYRALFELQTLHDMACEPLPKAARKKALAKFRAYCEENAA